MGDWVMDPAASYYYRMALNGLHIAHLNKGESK